MVNSTESDQQWRTLEEGYYKVNLGAAVDCKNQKICIGIVIRDWDGKVLESACEQSCEQRFCLAQPEIAECTALWRAVDLCMQMGFTKVVLEGDSLTIIRAVQNAEFNMSQYDQVVEDVKELLKYNQECSVNLVRRGCSHGNSG